MKRLQFRMHTIRLLAFFLFIFSMPPPILFAQLPAPPMLLSPDNGAVIGSPNPAFFWTPAQSVPDQLLFYRFRLVLLMSGQNSADAVKTNSPHHEQMMRRQGYQYPTDATPLNIGETYAWGVQVITRDETPMAANGGWTEVYTISIQSPPSAPIIVTTDPIVMTGQRPQSIAVTTDPIIMTGQRSQIIAVTTDPIIMTGQRSQNIAVTTDPIIMTGQRPQSIAVTTDPIIMTGQRGMDIEQSESNKESDSDSEDKSGILKALKERREQKAEEPEQEDRSEPDDNETPDDTTSTLPDSTRLKLLQQLKNKLNAEQP